MCLMGVEARLMRDKDGYVIVEGFARREVILQNIVSIMVETYLLNLRKPDPAIAKFLALKCIQIQRKMQRAHIMNSGILN